MKRNVSGLHGKNVTFLKGLKPVNAYIIKYTECGDYYAIGKTHGELYKFSAGTVNCVDYSELKGYGITLTAENWREFVDFDYKNPYSCKADALEMYKSIACAVCLVCLLVCLICVAVSVEPFPYEVYAAFIFLGTTVITVNMSLYAHYIKTNGERGSLSSQSPEDIIDYSRFNIHICTDGEEFSPNVYRVILLISAITLVSTIMHVREGLLYSAGGISGAVFLIVSLAVLGIMLRKGVRIKGIKWCILAIVMITYLLATLESNFWAKPIQFVLATVSVFIFVKNNKKY